MDLLGEGVNAAQQKAEHSIILPRKSSNSDNSGPFPRAGRQLVGQPCGIRTHRGGRAATGCARHSHNRYEETIRGVDGALPWTVDGKAVEVRSGQALGTSRGTVHRFDNLAIRDAKALCVITPATIRSAVCPRMCRAIGSGVRGSAGRRRRLRSSGVAA